MHCLVFLDKNYICSNERYAKKVKAWYFLSRILLKIGVTDTMTRVIKTIDMQIVIQVSCFKLYEWLTVRIEYWLK